MFKPIAMVKIISHGQEKKKVVSETSGKKIHAIHKKTN